ncbi:MAG: hypothetical protein AAFV45_04915 [Pseudomonadota bacterium]
MKLSIFGLIASIAFATCATTAQADMHTRGLWGDIDGPHYATPSSRRSYVGAGGQTRAYQPARKAKKKKKRTYAGSSYRKVYATPPRHVAGVGPRPGKWCGWWMRTQKGGGPEFNVAWNWRKYGTPVSGPRVGAVVIWRHHVGMITGQTANGRWIVKSGNDGNRVRERPRSVKGAVFRM